MAVKSFSGSFHSTRRADPPSSRVMLGSSLISGTPPLWKTTSIKFLDPLDQGLTVYPFLLVAEKYFDARLAVSLCFLGGGVWCRRQRARCPSS